MRPRCLTENDLPAVEELFLATFPHTPEGDLLISWEFRSKEKSMGIFNAEGLVGFVIASYHSSSGGSLYIDYFALKPEYRGSGLGTNFLLQLVTDAFDSNSSIHLYPERNELVRWYERNGFRKTHGGYYVFHSYKTRAQTRVHKMLGLA
jgi:ribosomal protein S18 acetylase RimI-like enzyme